MRRRTRQDFDGTVRSWRVGPSFPRRGAASAGAAFDPDILYQIKVDNPGEMYQPGQRAYVRFKLKKRPLIWQWSRRLFQLIQTKSGESEWN